MTKYLTTFLIAGVILPACNVEINVDSKARYVEEIRLAEAEFAKLVKENGMSVGFLEYAANDAVLNRNDILFKGKEDDHAVNIADGPWISPFVAKPHSPPPNDGSSASRRLNRRRARARGRC